MAIIMHALAYIVVDMCGCAHTYFESHQRYVYGAVVVHIVKMRRACLHGNSNGRQNERTRTHDRQYRVQPIDTFSNQKRSGDYTNPRTGRGYAAEHTSTLIRTYTHVMMKTSSPSSSHFIYRAIALSISINLTVTVNGRNTKFNPINRQFMHACVCVCVCVVLVLSRSLGPRLKWPQSASAS